MACEESQTISALDISNLKLDIQTVNDVVESAETTATTKDGKVIDTLCGRLLKLGYEAPNLYAASIVFLSTDKTKTIDRNGIIYAPLASALDPSGFTTSGTWPADDEDKFSVIQGLTTFDIPLPVANYTAMDALPALNTGAVVTLTDIDRSGQWVVDDSGLTVDVGTIRTWSNAVGAQKLRRLYEGPVNAKWFNVAGDGVTDDSANIQSVFDDFRAIYFPPGLYMCNDVETVLDGTKWVMSGDGPFETVFKAIDKEKSIIIFGEEFVHTGTAQAGAASTITLDTGASTSNDTYNNLIINISGGTGSGQSRLISDYTGSSRVATVSVAWATIPDATSTFEIEQIWGSSGSISISDIGFDGDSPAPHTGTGSKTKGAVEVRNCTHVYLDRIRIDNTLNSGLYVGSIGYSAFTNCIFRTSKFDCINLDSIDFISHAVTSLEISNCRVSGGAVSSIAVHEIFKVSIIDCVMEGSDIPIVVTGNSNRNLIIDRNYVEGTNGDYDIDFSASSGVDLSIRNNYLAGTPNIEGINVQPAASNWLHVRQSANVNLTSAQLYEQENFISDEWLAGSRSITGEAKLVAARASSSAQQTAICEIETENGFGATWRSSSVQSAWKIGMTRGSGFDDTDSSVDAFISQNTNNSGGWNIEPDGTYGLHVFGGAGSAKEAFICSSAAGDIMWTGSLGAASQGTPNAAAASLKLKAPNTTGRSINASGTINASGADYAEYMTKSPNCGDISKGDVCGIDVNGEITDKFADAISFAIKSTNPSYVGGDTWGDMDKPKEGDYTKGIIRPELTSYTKGITHPSKDDQLKGLSDKSIADSKRDREAAKRGRQEYDKRYALAIDEYEKETAKAKASFEADKDKHDKDLAEAVGRYNLDLSMHDAELDARRDRVDRIAFCGQVPVNVANCKVGDYIVPANSNGGISATAVKSPNLKQYIASIGKVITVAPNSRPIVIVKVS